MFLDVRDFLKRYYKVSCRNAFPQCLAFRKEIASNELSSVVAGFARCLWLESLLRFMIRFIDSFLRKKQEIYIYATLTVRDIHISRVSGQELGV